MIYVIDIIQYCYIWQRLFAFSTGDLSVFKKIFITLVILAVLAFGGLSVYVSTIDWNLHKNKIATQFEQVSGKKIVFEGDVSLSFLPSPYLTAKNIKIFNKTGEKTTTPLAVIKEMVVELSLMPLIKGNFVVNKMTILHANILIDFLPNGKLNWYSEISDMQRDKIDAVEVALNSVLLKDAKVQIINDGLGINVTMQELNAEVMAETLSGPYRIDGNFVKDGEPAGFALNLGTLNENFATSLNLVLTHPKTDSYARFDGSMLSSNKEIKGNFVFESKKPSTFLNSLTNQTILPEEFNYPIASSIELITNEHQIDLSSFVIKYGDNTAGSGNILIPLVAKNDEEKRKIEAAFEMTDLDLMPIIGMIKEQLKKYDNNRTPYTPYFDFDLIADVTSVKANYNNNIVRNLIFSVNLINDVITIKELSGLLPGDTDVSVKGDIFESEKVLSYNFDVKYLSQDFYKFIETFNIKPKTYAQSTYRNSEAEFSVSGNLNQIKIAPINFTLDKTSAEGIIGLVRKNRKNIFVSLSANEINFDNYLPKLSEEEQKLPLNEKIKISLNKLKFLNNYDITGDTKLALGIYNGNSFENMSIKFTSDKENINLKNVSIENLNNASISLKGNISQIGTDPEFKNIKYTFKTDKFKSFMQKLGINTSDIKFLENVQNINANGIFTGDINNINIRAKTSFERLSSMYSGRIFNKEDTGFGYLGKLEFKTPDFVSFINNIGYKYNPKYMVANLFTFKADINGNMKKFNIKNMDAFVGTNNFKGNLTIENDTTHKINADITANKFEFDRFIPAIENKIVKNIKKAINTDNIVSFIAKPEWSTNEINYAIYKDIELNGKFKFEHFSIGTTAFDDTNFEANIKQGIIDIKNISVLYQQIPLKGNLTFDITKTPTVKGHIESNEYNIEGFGGKKYEFMAGNTIFNFDFEGKATSEFDFVNSLNGKLVYNIKDALIKGLNLKAIETDVTFRDRSDNLYEMLRKELSEGQTDFYSINAELNIKDGEFELANSYLKSTFAEMTMSGNGNLATWEINNAFSLTFNQFTDQIPPIEIKWNGHLNNPNVVINADQLKNKYDVFWNKIEEEQRAQEKAIRDALDVRMNATQDKITLIKEMIELDVEPKLNKYEPMNSNITTKSRYESMSIQAQDIKNQLYNMEKAKDEYFDDEIINQMDAKLEVFQPQIENIIRELDETYIIDLKNMADLTYQNIKNIYDYSLQKGINYQKTLNAYVNRLIEIKSLVILDNELKIADDKNKVETNLRTIADIHQKAVDNATLINNSDSINDIEMLYQVALELYEKTKTEMESLNTEIKTLFEDAKAVVVKEEELAIEKLEALKEAQKETILEQEKNKNLLDKETKPKSKIIIIEEGQKPVDPLPKQVTEEPEIQEPTVEETIKEMEEALFKPKEEPVINEEIEEVLPQRPIITPENPFAGAAATINEEVTEPVVESETAPENVVEAPVEVSVEIPTPEPEEVATPAEPLLKAVSGATYKPKTIATGVITKPASAKQKEIKLNEPENKPLLKPIISGTVTSGGTITKNK